MMNDVHKRIKQARDYNELKQAQAAQLLDISVQSLSRYERAIREPSASTLIKMSRVYNCNLYWLQTGIEPEQQDSRNLIPSMILEHNEKLLEKLEAIEARLDSIEKGLNLA